MTSWEVGGGESGARGGCVPSLYQQPLQIGLSGSPCSNSIHTPAPIGGTQKKPIGGPVPAAIGRHGRAHVVGVSPRTSVTKAWSRPSSCGSSLSKTMPRYLP